MANCQNDYKSCEVLVLAEKLEDKINNIIIDVATVKAKIYNGMSTEISNTNKTVNQIQVDMGVADIHRKGLRKVIEDNHKEHMEMYHHQEIQDAISGMSKVVKLWKYKTIIWTTAVFIVSTVYWLNSTGAINWHIVLNGLPKFVKEMVL